jgi:hypothetical protein
MKRKALLPYPRACLVLVLWSPWINGQYAKERSVAEFERAWLNVADGCGFFVMAAGQRHGRRSRLGRG